ncbi:MAG: hypothetical protein EBY29_12640, partial [Planctomycetes bacterium]|nr:hypothetical protein [Planctomycetota bacterium]
QRFQLAVLGRRSLGTRMRCLRDLLARAPRNDALRNLTKRYESEALATLEASCRAAASRGETKPLRDALEAIDGFGWRGQLSESFCRWLEEELQRERRHSAKEAYSVLAARIEAAYAARDLSLLGSLTDEADELEREQRVTPGDNFRVRIREAMSWAESEMARLRQLAAHSDACESLQQSLNTGTTAAEAEGLCSNILSTGLAVPDHLVERCRQLRADEARSRQTKVALIVVGFLLAFGALVVIVIAVLR